MSNKMLFLIGMVIAMALSTKVHADPFEEGLSAYIKGQPQVALKLWQPLASEGHAAAQFHLGHIYRTGEGVKPDSAEALKWYRKAAAQGHTTAGYYVRKLEHDLGRGKVAMQ